MGNENTSTAAISSADASHVDDDIDDFETRSVVSSQYKLQKNTLYAIIGIIVLYVVYVAIATKTVSAPLIAAFLGIFVIGFVAKAVDFLIFKGMRLVRFGRCVSRIQECVSRYLTVSLDRVWKEPSPAVIALDSSRKILFVEGANTDFERLILTSDQIIDCKVERQQTTVTNTKHRASAAVGFAPSFVRFGLLGAGRSKSTSKTIEEAFLEITYANTPNDPPTRLVFYFGTARRDADDWALAIKRIR